MKKLFVLIMLAFSMLFFACEEDVIPIPLPPPAQAVNNETAPPADGKTEPQVVAEKPSEPVKAPAKVAKEPPPPRETAKPVAYYSGDAEQLSRGRYIIQIAVVPLEASARKLIKKLADEGIKAYNAKVDNPDPEKGMIGTYNRVRIGFFDAKPAAEAFAKARLEPLGYRWWIDKSRNDNIGKLMDSEPSEPFVVKKIPDKQMSEQERKDAEKEAAIAAAKEEYKAIAKAANASVSSAPALPPPKIPAKANPPPPVIKTPASDDSRGRVKMKSQRQQ